MVKAVLHLLPTASAPAVQQHPRRGRFPAGVTPIWRARCMREEAALAQVISTAPQLEAVAKAPPISARPVWPFPGIDEGTVCSLGLDELLQLQGSMRLMLAVLTGGGAR